MKRGVHSRKTINGKHYVLEAWLLPVMPGGVYRFGIQGWSIKGAPYSFSVRLPEEFIEDEIDNEKRPKHLERVALRVAENHFQDMMTLKSNTGMGGIDKWFKEAKEQIDNEAKGRGNFPAKPEVKDENS